MVDLPKELAKERKRCKWEGTAKRQLGQWIIGPARVRKFGFGTQEKKAVLRELGHHGRVAATYDGEVQIGHHRNDSLRDNGGQNHQLRGT